jgi:hypothetical protein
MERERERERVKEESNIQKFVNFFMRKYYLSLWINTIHL